MAISLKAARVNAELTIDEAAIALEISKGTLVNYEKYRTTPDIVMAKKMASLYNMSIDDIIFFA